MEIKLAESIRTFRKERSLTQEQLAEVLGVTVGAVYKWEAGLSTPELPLIVEMADFFDTSIDVLLGYILKDNRIDATARRLRRAGALTAAPPACTGPPSGTPHAPGEARPPRTPTTSDPGRTASARTRSSR